MTMRAEEDRWSVHGLLLRRVGFSLPSDAPRRQAEAYPTGSHNRSAESALVQRPDWTRATRNPRRKPGLPGEPQSRIANRQ